MSNKVREAFASIGLATVSKVLAVVVIGVLSVTLIPGKENPQAATPGQNRTGRATVGGVNTYCSEQLGNTTGGCYSETASNSIDTSKVQTIQCDSSGKVPAGTVKSYLGSLIKITVNNGTATITNNTSCILPVSLAAYRMYDNRLGSQQFNDGTGVIMLKPGETRVVSVRISDCPTQIDVYYGAAPIQLDDANSAQNSTLAWGFNFDTKGKDLKDLTGPFCGQAPPPPFRPTPPPPVVCVPTTTALSAEAFYAALSNGYITVNAITSDLNANKATVTIKNTTNQIANMSLSSYQMFDAVLSHQQFYNGTGIVAVPACGEKTLTVNLPSCAAQIDLWFGQHPTTLLQTNPYGYPNNPFVVTFAYVRNTQLCGQHPNLTIAKSGPGSINRDQELVYTVTATNTGNATAQNVVVTDEVMVPLTFVRSSGATCAVENSARTPRGVVRCTVGELGASMNKVITLTFKVDATAVCQSVITNKADVEFTGGAKVTSNAVLTTVNCPTPGLVCTPTNQTVNINQTAAFAASGGTGAYSWAAGTGDPALGTGSTFATKYQVAGSKTVTVTSGSQSVNCAVMVNQPTPPPPGSPRLTIEKVVRNVTQNSSFVDSVSAKTSEVLEYRVRIWNDGAATANNVILTDVLSNSTTLTNFGNLNVSVNNSGLLYAGGLQLGTIAAGASVTVTYRYNVVSSITSGVGVCNTATAKSDNAGSVQDAACVTVPQIQGGNVILSFSKKATNNTKNQDATKVVASREDFITYTLTATNSGNSDQTSFIITDDLSGVLPLADMIDTGGATVTGNVITYPAITIPAGKSVDKQFRVRVKSGLASNISYVMKNTYGNTVNITINNPQDYVAPKTGGNTGPLAAVGFAGLLTVGFVLSQKKNLLKMIFS